MDLWEWYIYVHERLIFMVNVVDPMGYGMDLFELFNPKFVKCHWCHWYFHLPLPWIKVDKKNPPPTKRSSLEKKMLPFQSEKMVACYWQMGLTTDPPCFVIFHWDMNLAKTPANSVPFQMNNLDNLASCKSLQVLQRSGLTSADLAQIWSLSDVARGWKNGAEWDWNLEDSGIPTFGLSLWYMHT